MTPLATVISNLDVTSTPTLIVCFNVSSVNSPIYLTSYVSEIPTAWMLFLSVKVLSIQPYLVKANLSPRSTVFILMFHLLIVLGLISIWILHLFLCTHPEAHRRRPLILYLLGQIFFFIKDEFFWLELQVFRRVILLLENFIFLTIEVDAPLSSTTCDDTFVTIVRA